MVSISSACMRHARRALWLLLSGGALLSGCGRAGTSYVNPLKTAEGDTLRIADPFIYKGADNMYYLTGTSGSNGFDCYKSEDLVTWNFAGELYRPAEGHFGTDAFWAPEVKYYKGGYYLTYSCLDPESGRLLPCLAWSGSPEGPFRDLYLPWFDFGYSAIDCHIFVDDDGSPYLYFSRNGAADGYTYGEIYAARLKDDLSGPDGEPVPIMKASQPWERVRWSVNRCNEGPFVIKSGGRYYMTYSANDTGYEHYGVGVAVADAPLGPWEKYEDNPLMTTDMEKGVSSPGHNSIVESPDGSEMFVVYHRHTDTDGPRPSYDRMVCIDRMRIDDDGKLRIDGPTVTPQPMPR